MLKKRRKVKASAVPAKEKMLLPHGEKLGTTKSILFANHVVRFFTRTPFCQALNSAKHVPESRFSKNFLAVPCV